MKGRQAAIWLALWLPASVGLHASAFSWAMQRHSEQRDLDELPPKPSVLGGGETFDIETERATDAPQVDPSTAQTEANAALADANEKRAKARDRRSPVKSADSREGDNEGAYITALFGAAGDRSAVDLATAFTRAFPQTASADPIWANAKMGSAGDVDVVLQIDDAGNLVRAEVGSGGSHALHRDVERTVALLRHRLFTATRLTTTLTISANVSPDSVRDDVHGNVFALGGSFSSNEGSAFFSLAIGKRIDVRITSH